MGSDYKQNTEVMETRKVGPALKTQQDKKALDEGLLTSASWQRRRTSLDPCLVRNVKVKCTLTRPKSDAALKIIDYKDTAQVVAAGEAAKRTTRHLEQLDLHT